MKSINFGRIDAERVQRTDQLSAVQRPDRDDSLITMLARKSALIGSTLLLAGAISLAPSGSNTDNATAATAPTEVTQNGVQFYQDSQGNSSNVTGSLSQPYLVWEGWRGPG